ncbi:MAG: hypothetical protein RLZZ269_1432 [Actinomycetota bacterium]
MRPLRFARSSAAVALLVGALAGCGEVGSDLTLVSSSDKVVPDDKPSREYDRFLADSIASIEAFWAEQYPEHYAGDYPRLVGGVHAHFPQRQAPLPEGCDFSGEYADVEDNAFYCDEGDFIVYDDELLLPSFVDEFGIAVAGVIMAHEWGHAIQGPLRNDVLDLLPTPTLELQADCFTGAWFAHAQKTGIGEYDLSDEDITGALLGLVQLGDAPGDDASDPAAHGSAFDRVSAFQDGYLGGVAPCVDYEFEGPVVLQFGFTPEELSRPNPSDFPFDDAMFESLSTDLTLFWTTLIGDEFPTWREPNLVLAESDQLPPVCSVGLPTDPTLGVWVCPDDFTVAIDVSVAVAAYDEIPGDFAVGYLLAVGWGELVQSATDVELTGEDRQLLNDCLAGMWAGDILPFNDQPVAPSTEESPRVGLSPGDLDEAIRMAILLGDRSRDDDVMGSAFEKVDAFRQGVLFGSSGCFG